MLSKRIVYKKSPNNLKIKITDYLLDWLREGSLQEERLAAVSSLLIGQDQLGNKFIANHRAEHILYDCVVCVFVWMFAPHTRAAYAPLHSRRERSPPHHNFQNNDNRICWTAPTPPPAAANPGTIYPGKVARFFARPGEAFLSTVLCDLSRTGFSQLCLQ